MAGLAPVDISYTKFLGVTRSRQVLGFCRLRGWELPDATRKNDNDPEPLKVLEDISFLVPEARVVSRDKHIIGSQGYMRVEVFDLNMSSEPLLREISLGLDNWAQLSK